MGNNHIGIYSSRRIGSLHDILNHGEKGEKEVMGRKLKTLIPNDFRDFLSIISLVGFIGIALFFFFGIEWINENMTSIFLILGGASFLIIGKVITVAKWMKDGIQQNEISQLIAIVFGLSSIIVGVMMVMGIEIGRSNLVGVIAIVPAIYIFVDYIAKNN